MSQDEYCELIAIASSTFHDWQLRAEVGQLEAEEPVPDSFPQATGLENVEEILTLCLAHPDWGGKKISDYLLKEGRLYTSPGTAQKIKNRINTELNNLGYELEFMMRFEVLAPNDLWATDIIEFDWYGQTLYVLVLFDEHSRFILDWRISTSPTTELAVTLVDESIASYARPRAVKSDNGPQYRKTFAAELEKRGIHNLSSPPFFPQYNGKLERLNSDLKGVVTKASELDLKSISDLLAEKVHEHNFIRPHQALGGVTPHTCYTGEADEKKREMAEFKTRELECRGFHASHDNTNSKPEGILTPIRRDGETVLCVRSFYEVFFQ